MRDALSPAAAAGGGELHQNSLPAVLTVFLGALLLHSVVVATVVSLSAAALAGLAAVMESVTCSRRARDHTLSYHKVLGEAGSDSEEEVFSKQESRAQRQPELFRKEKVHTLSFICHCYHYVALPSTSQGLLLAFVGVGSASVVTVVLSIASFSWEED